MQPNRQTVGLPCCKGALPAQGQWEVHQNLMVLLCRSVFQLVILQHVLLPGVIPPQVQDFAFSLRSLHESPLCSNLQPAEVPLNGPQLSGLSATPPSLYHLQTC